MGAGITSAECIEQDTVNISQEEVSSWLRTPLDVSITTIVVPIIWCIGLITNLTFLFVVFRVRKLRSDTNIYLVHLSLADLLYLSLSSAFNLGTYIASVVEYHLPFVNSFQCASFHTAINTGYFSSIALVTMVSFERFLALCHPMKHLKIRGRRRTHTIITICWLVGFLLSASTIPNVLDFNVVCLNWPDDNGVDTFLEYPSSFAYCGPVSPLLDYIIPPLLHTPWIMAMVASVVMYAKILQVLSKRTLKDNMSVKNNHHVARIRKQVAKMLVVNGTVFFLCQALYYFFYVSRWICLLAQIPDPFVAALGARMKWVAVIPQYINAVINPLIYSAVNPAYRSAFKLAFKCTAQAAASRHSVSVSVLTGTKHSHRAASSTDESTETRL